ncbi:MAG TPA: adventurous gliding motility lipoprotein CglB [Myxococcales bacterium]|nr:adventurous gliding motility lipoprotein CglB [Myxococcales bacterium]
MTSPFPRRAGSFLAFASSLAVAALAGGCQSYDLEPVVPLALRSVHKKSVITHLKPRPDLMLMVDKSFSMRLPTNPADSNCPAGCGAPGALPCPSSCPTRWSELVGAMDGFLTDYGSVARMGLAPFGLPQPPPWPSLAEQCVPGAVQVDISTSNDVPGELQANAAAINAAIRSQPQLGGTPTSATLQILSAQASLANPDRDDYVLLLTDGIPNCNPDNPNNFKVDPAACRCTDLTAATCNLGEKLFCLDQDATVSQLSALKAQGVKTVVVGLGTETGTGVGPVVLTEMGKAGGYTLTCPQGTDAECAGGVCNVADQTCSNTYYQASNGQDLSRALARLAEGLNPRPCEYELPMTPSEDEFLSVLVDNAPVASGTDTWRYSPPDGSVTPPRPPQVFLEGALCDKAKLTTTLNPMIVEIEILQAL